jgi:regulatory protein
MKIIRPSGRSKKNDSSSASENEAVGSDGYDGRRSAGSLSDEKELKENLWKSKSSNKRSGSSKKRCKFSNKSSQISNKNSRSSLNNIVSEDEFEFDTSNLEAMPKDEVFDGPSKGKTRRRSELPAEKDSESLKLLFEQADQKFIDMFARGLRLLSMREHSVKELTKKLFDKFEAAIRAKDLKEAENSKKTEGCYLDKESATYEDSSSVEGADISHTIYAVIDDLIEKEYLSDERFTEVYIRSRCLRGFGPVKIKAELKNKGVSNHLIQDYLDPGAAIWFDNAKSEYLKKYAGGPIGDYSSWAKRARFLQSRGFNMDQIQCAIEPPKNNP